MDANTRTPRELFDGTVCYEIPPFQRPYVWNEEDQWQPLWDDIERLADAFLEHQGDQERLDAIPRHFLGAVVLKQLSHAAGDPARHSVIDGQQRMTTLQVLIDAAQLVLHQHGDEGDAESLQELVANSANRFRETAKRFKLWPSRADRAAFEHVMDNHLNVSAELIEARIAQAHRFFYDAVRQWAEVTGDPDKALLRLSILTHVLQQQLQMVAIDLGPTDDDQLIFETLNDRGTPLLQADLIKNFVFQRCEEIGADVDAWSETYWQDFDSDWWREQVAQGRLFRSRIDLFLQYWLTMRILDEIPTDAVFARFRAYALEHLADEPAAEAFLQRLRRDAETFRDFASLDPTTVRGRFYSRVVEALELGAFIPLLLWMISDTHASSDEQVNRALAAVESWAVRRTLLRRTMKNVNKLVVALLREIEAEPLERVGDTTVTFLLGQTADAQEWPKDEEVTNELPKIKAYGNIKQPRLRAILSAVELQARTERHESVTLPTKLEVEHIMPRAWRTHWGENVASNIELAVERDRLVNTLGNLTLVTQKLNGTLSNRPWRDNEAAVVAPSGRDAGKGKRSLLSRFSVLVLNKDIVDGHPEAWTDDDIRKRSELLARAVTTIWLRG